MDCSNFPGLLGGQSLAFIKYESEGWLANQFLILTLTEGYATIMVSRMYRMVHGDGRKMTITLCFLVFLSSCYGIFYFMYILKHDM